MRTEILLSGAGGQGLILAGAILAEAAGIYEEQEVVQTQAYGIQARGGASHSTVIISGERIKYPEVRHPDILLCLSQEAYHRFSPYLKKRGLLVVDADLIQASFEHEEIEIVALPFTKEAELLGRRILANLIALGAISELSGIVKVNSIARAIPSRLPERNVPAALEALRVGARLAEEVNIIQK
jgi:2-oxoglutarate ferredoxin oxidoreductase subunit gamma